MKVQNDIKPFFGKLTKIQTLITHELFYLLNLNFTSKFLKIDDVMKVENYGSMFIKLELMKKI